MAGGRYQLVLYGKEDLFLTRDPQITFFKIIYRRHTNFVREDVCQFFTNEPDFGKRSTCIISPEADLIDNMALRIILPRIPKISNTDIKNRESQTKFAWIRRIGHAMIKYIEIEINGKIIDRHYGEWLHIWSTLTTRNINDKGFDKLIGNVPELTEFTNGKDEYTLYIPLYFWFCRTSGLSLPLVSLQYSDVKINVEFYDLEQCYYVNPTQYIKCNSNIVNYKPNEFLFQKGSDNIERYGIYSHYDVVTKRLYYMDVSLEKLTGVPYEGKASLLSSSVKSAILSSPTASRYEIIGVSTDFSIIPDLGVRSITSHRKSLRNIVMKECVLLVDYVYLDDDERFKFAQTKQDYLIEQLYFTPNITIEGTNRKVKLDIDQPCKLTVWLVQFDYIARYNDRFNYTDTHVLKRKYDINYTDPTKLKIYDNVPLNESIGLTLIDNSEIKLNSQERLSSRTSKYYEYVQPIQNTKNILPKGVSQYSYALFPTEPSPSGTTNMSQIELIELLLQLNFKINVNRKAKFRSYSLVNMVWRVNNGLSAQVFVR